MKESVRSLAGLIGEKVMVRSVCRTLNEGEALTEAVYLRGGVIYVLTVEGWENIGAMVLRITDRMGETLGPEADNATGVLYFVPFRSGDHSLTVSLEATARGKASAEVKVVVMEVGGAPQTIPGCGDMTGMG